MFIHLTRIQGTIHKYINNVIIDNTLITRNLRQDHFMVSEALDNPELSQARTIQFILDLLDLTFAELFYGFPQYLQGLLDFSKETLWKLKTPESFYQIYQVFSK